MKKGGIYYLMLLSLCACLFLGVPGETVSEEEQERPDFSGTWKLDSDASDPIDEILKAQGISRLKRIAAKRMRVTQKITQTGEEMTIVINSNLKPEKTNVLKFDGTREKKESDQGGTVWMSTSWSEDNQALMTTAELNLKDGTSTEMQITRTLTDNGKTMNQLIELKHADGKSYKANRVFRKS